MGPDPWREWQWGPWLGGVAVVVGFDHDGGLEWASAGSEGINDVWTGGSWNQLETACGVGLRSGDGVRVDVKFGSREVLVSSVRGGLPRRGGGVVIVSRFGRRTGFYPPLRFRQRAVRMCRWT